jgi:hypothetical protein
MERRTIKIPFEGSQWNIVFPMSEPSLETNLVKATPEAIRRRFLFRNDIATVFLNVRLAPETCRGDVSAEPE